MSLDALLDALPDYAADVRRSLASALGDSPLTDRQAWGAALAAAVSARDPEALAAIAAGASARLAPAEVEAAKSAAALMAMTTVYYRARHHLGGEYEAMPARLSQRVGARPGVDRADFELWALAAVAVAGCEVCLRNHEGKLVGRGAASAVAQEGLRIAAAVHAAAVVLGAERALRG